jgi:hypothetical protein
MTHFSPEEWADFARQHVAPELEGRMQEHLESGCELCVQTLQTWLGVLEVASALNIYSPPESAVRFVKALYSALPPQRIGHLRLEVSRLIFPSGEIPLLEGMRSGEGARRHFLFQRDNLLLDVHIETRPESGAVSLAGQILNPVESKSPLGSRPVSLLAETSEIARTMTNQFGEFHLEFQPAEDLMLVVNLENEAMLVTPLPVFALAASAAGSGLEFGPEDNDANDI